MKQTVRGWRFVAVAAGLISGVPDVLADYTAQSDTARGVRWNTVNKAAALDILPFFALSAPDPLEFATATSATSLGIEGEEMFHMNLTLSETLLVTGAALLKR